jgi:group I intron endonuclease
MIGIYKITNTINQKVYVGSTNDIGRRWKEHIDYLNENNHHCLRLQKDWNTYDINNFSFSIIEFCQLDNLLDEEQKYIDYYFNIGEIYNTKLKVNKSSKVIQKNKKEKIVIPNGLINKPNGIMVDRMLMYMLRKCINEKTNDINFTVGEFVDAINIKSNNMYEIISSNIDNINKLKINNIKLCKNIFYDCPFVRIIINDTIFNQIIKSKNCSIIYNSFDEFSKIRCSKTLITLLKTMENNKKLNIQIEDFKKLISVENQYSNYSDFKRSVIKPILKDLECMGYKISFKEIKRVRSIETLEFLITK